MIRVVVNGALGRMGSIAVEKIRDAQDMELAAAVDITSQSPEVLSDLMQYDGPADVLIDFSYHTATPAIMDWATAHQVAVIMCTTGHVESEKEAIYTAARKIPVFYSANMSLGVALLVEMAKQCAAAFPEADIEIVETHHNRKADAPSGTALMLGKAIQKVRPNSVFCMGRSGMAKRTKEEIGFHAIRRGNIPGIHEVIVSTDNQAVTLRHEVYDRALFADGALAAVRFLQGKPAGLYEMVDIVGKR